tara:strand:+ start:398 stop:586 length:189 start_codon:yes stop_codon:yes gene_type:complete
MITLQVAMQMREDPNAVQQTILSYVGTPYGEVCGRRRGDDFRLDDGRRISSSRIPIIIVRRW